MAQGYLTTKVPVIRLLATDIVVHPAAREAFAFFMRYRANRKVTIRYRPLAPPVLQFVSRQTDNPEEGREGDDERKHMESRQLVGGFEQMVLLSETAKIAVKVVDQILVDDDAIEEYAWQQALLTCSLRSSDKRAAAAFLNGLIESFPERLVDRVLARDRQTSHGTRLTIESLCRAFGVSSESVRRYMPEVKRGGIGAHSYIDQIAREDSDAK